MSPPTTRRACIETSARVEHYLIGIAPVHKIFEESISAHWFQQNSQLYFFCTGMYLLNILNNAWKSAILRSFDRPWGPPECLEYDMPNALRLARLNCLWFNRIEVFILIWSCKTRIKPWFAIKILLFAIDKPVFRYYIHSYGNSDW